MMAQGRSLTGGLVLVMASALCVGSAAADSDGVASAIRRVTVYSDRARVTRVADVRLRDEASSFRFTKLPGWVDEGSVRVALVPATAGRIVDVQIRRLYMARSQDAENVAAQKAVADLQAKRQALTDEIGVLEARAKQIAAIKVFSAEKLTAESAARPIDVAEYGKVIDFVSDALRGVAKSRREVARKQAALMPELAAAQKRLQERQSMTQLQQTEVSVTVEGPSGQDARLELTYMLPGATWEPTHELRTAAAKPGTAALTSYAVVTQTSGEDWEGAALSFATQSASEAIKIPALDALTLGDSSSARRIYQARISSFKRAQKAFEGQNMLWNRMQANQDARQVRTEVYESNFRYMNVVQTKTIQIFESLQKRGTTAHFKGTRRVTVRGDGHSVRVPIGHADLASSVRIVAAPEQSLNAARVLEMKNSSAQPLLPGQVALYQDGAFLGLTRLDFIAEREAFSVFLAVADQIKLTRRLDKEHSSLVRKVKTRMQVAFVVTVQNLSKAAATVELADRVPISRNREIKVDRVQILPRQKPDSRGLVRWEVVLAPGETRTFRVGYRMEYPPTLVLRTRALRKRRAASPAAGGRSFEFDDYQIHDQIDALEKKF